MLRAAHYKSDALDLPQPGKSPPKHRPGGFMDLALTAADKYALSLLPTALKGTGLSSNDVHASADFRPAPQQQPSAGVQSAFKLQRGGQNPLQTLPAQPQGGAAYSQSPYDNRMESSWDANLKEILAALEPADRTLKPAKLRDHKYPNQNHGMPMNVTLPPPRRELDEALLTLPGGTRRNKTAIPSYTAALKGFSRQSRRADVQAVDVQYDVVPGVRLAWAGPSAATYSISGFGGSPKKYTSQLVGRVSPHYSGMPMQAASSGASPGSQDPVHLPDISPNYLGQGTSTLRSASFGSPSYQGWTNSGSPGSLAGHGTPPRKALPYVSSNTPSLAKPISVQYHPVLKSSSLNIASAAGSQAPLSGAPQPSAPPIRSTPQRPGTDLGCVPYLPLPIESSITPTKPLPHGSPSYRLVHTPPEIAAEVARLRHVQELDGVINGLRSDLQRAASPRNEVPIKSKFLQMYEDPNRPLARLNPKQFLADMLPPQQPQVQHRRQRTLGITTDKRSSAGGSALSPSGSPSSSGAVVRSPMYERRLKPLPSNATGNSSSRQRDSGGVSEGGAEPDGLQNVHLALSDEGPQTTGEECQASQPRLGPQVTSSGRSTPRSLLLEPEDTALTQADLVAGDLAIDEAAADPTEGFEPQAASGLQEAELQAAEEAGAASDQAAALPAPSEGVEGDVQAAVTGAEGPADAAPDSAAAEEPGAEQAVQPSTDVDAQVQGKPGSQPVPEGEDEVVSGASEPAAAAAAGEQPAASEVVTAAQEQEATSSAETEPAAARAELSGQADDEPAPVPQDAAPEAADVGSSEGPCAPASVPEPPADGATEAVADPATEATSPEASADVAVEDGQKAPAKAEGAEDAPGEGAEWAAASPAETAPNSGEASTSADGAEAAEPQARDERAVLALPPSVTPEMAEASIVCIQAHVRGYQDRRRVADLRKRRDAGEEAGQPTPTPPSAMLGHALPPGVTEEMATAAVIRIQSHARGYFARRQVAELRRDRAAGEAALATAVNEAAKRKLDGYELPPGVTPEMAEAAVLCIQSHARGHQDRRRVQHLRAARAADNEGTEGDAQQRPGPEDEPDTSLREAGAAVSTGAGGEEASQQPRTEEPGAEEDAAVAEPPAAVKEEAVQELTVDALKAALADDDEDQPAAAEQQEQPQADTFDEPDPSDPAAVAAAAAKAAIRMLNETPAGGDGVADTAAAVDQQQTAEEASLARLAANSARTSAMFQGAGAEVRFSDDEASALELMDNLDGLLQGDDEAAAAAAAVAAAAAPAEGELVSISAEGVSEPQALGSSTSGAVPPNPMDVLEPGGVRVLASKYEVQHVVGEGAYGMVMKCKVRGTEPVQWVAIKEFKIDDSDPDAEDVKRTSLREVAVLEALQHPHVVGFVDKFMVGDRLFIVMEFLPCNLLELLEAQPGGMDRDAVRLIMFQMCSAIAFIHSKGMVYRDIKPENLLVDEHGTVKLCDFGFARYLPSSPSSHLTDYVATRWYRAPELLLGPPYRDAQGKHMQCLYGPQVDMWAVGCLMGELLDGEPLFAGDSDLDQLYRVQQILGPMAPSHQYLFYANPHNAGIVFNIKQPVTLGSRYRGKVSEVELSFMAGLLEMDPEKRLTGEQCLQHPYLVDLAAAANVLPTPTASSTMTPRDGSSGGGESEELSAGPDPAAAGPVADTEGPEVAAVSFSGPAPLQEVPAPVSPSPMAPGADVTDSRVEDKVGSLNRAAGSLTRGGRSLSRGSKSPALYPTAGGSPGPGSGSMRARANLRTSNSGRVVIVEGVEEGDETAGDVLGSAHYRASVTAGLSEIEPAE